MIPKVYHYYRDKKRAGLLPSTDGWCNTTEKRIKLTRRWTIWSSGDEDEGPWTSDNDEREGEGEEREDEVDKFEEEDKPKEKNGLREYEVDDRTDNKIVD